MSKPPDLTRIPIPRGILYLAVPTFASHFLETSYHVVNGIWVGRIGTESLAAMNASAFFIWLMYSQLGVVSTGAAALVANCVGAGRRDEARRVAVQAIWLGVALAFVMLLLGLVVREPVLRAMGLEPEVVRLGSQYLGVLFLVIPAMAFDEVMAANLRGYGDTRTPTVVWAGVLLINIAVVPFLVLGAGPIPPLGLVGAALATGIGMHCGVLAYLVLMAMGRLPFGLRSGPGPSYARDLLRIGFPTAFSSVIFCLVYMGLTRVLSEFGTPAVAAVGIGHRVESLNYMLCLGFSLAAITMVGQNKGAGQLDRAERSAWVATGMACAFTGAISVIMIAFPRELAGVFTDDAEVLSVAAAYIRVIGFSQVFMALDIVLEGAFSGAGDTVPTMVISIPLTLARIPLAWYASLHLHHGVQAVWWVISGLMILRGLIMAYWFSRNHWKTRKVITTSQPLPFGDEEADAVSTAV